LQHQPFPTTSHPRELKKKTGILHRNLEGTFHDLNERLPDYFSNSSPHSPLDYLHLKASGAALIVTKTSVHTFSEEWIQFKGRKNKWRTIRRNKVQRTC
jgi:hypothetical protein